MKKYISFFHCIAACLLFSLGACKKHKENKIQPDKEYIRYVNTSTIQTDLVPLDMVKTVDEGFLILGSSPSKELLYHQTYLLKIDKEGKYEWDTYLPSTFLNPVSSILAKDGSYYFFCMDLLTGTHLVKINESTHTADPIKYWDEIQLPLHASATPDGGFLVLNAHLGDKWTGLTKIGPDLNATWRREYTFDENFSDVIDRHVKKESAPLPFFTGTVQNGGNVSAYYFNAYFDANFSCVFVNPTNGRTNGYTYLGGDRAYASMRNVLPLESGVFAMSWYDRNSNNYFVPRKDLVIQSPTPTAVTGLGGQRFADMEADSRVLCKRLILAGRDVLVYSANTKNKGIGLYAFDVSTGTFLGNKLLSLETPFEMGGFATTSDGGLAIMAKTYVLNRFPRVCLIKLSDEEVKKLVAM